LCEDGFILENGNCSNYFPVMFLDQINLNMKNHIDKKNISYSISKLSYKVSMVFLSEYKQYISFDDLELIYSKKTEYFKNTKFLSSFFKTFKTTCQKSNISSSSLTKSCNKSTSHVMIDLHISEIEDHSSEKIPNCEEYKNKNICKKCKTNFELSPERNSCIKPVKLHALKIQKVRTPDIIISPLICLKTFYYNSKFRKCLKNIGNCLRMSSSGKCQKCFPFYFLNQSHTECMKCSENCVECTFSNICLQCQDGFYLSFDIGKISKYT
jgi:hypothetical protein